MKSQLSNAIGSEAPRFLNLADRFRRTLPPEQAALLPQMHDLIARLRQCTSPGHFDGLTGASCGDVVSYRAQVESGRPCIRFNIIAADATLLSFLRRPSVPFEVLQLSCAGLQYHWRSDLAKILENRTALVGRMSVMADRLDAVVDHLAIPVLEKQGVREIRGWFAFSHLKWEGRSEFDWSEVAIVRRSQRSRQVSLPARLLRPERASRFWLRKSDAASGSGATSPSFGATTGMSKP